jgi:hypothetical protein
MFLKVLIHLCSAISLISDAVTSESKKAPSSPPSGGSVIIQEDEEDLTEATALTQEDDADETRVKEILRQKALDEFTCGIKITTNLSVYGVNQHDVSIGVLKDKKAAEYLARMHSIDLFNQDRAAYAAYDFQTIESIIKLTLNVEGYHVGCVEIRISSHSEGFPQGDEPQKTLLRRSRGTPQYVITRQLEEAYLDLYGALEEFKESLASGECL